MFFQHRSEGTVMTHDVFEMHENMFLTIEHLIMECIIAVHPKTRYVIQ